MKSFLFPVLLLLLLAGCDSEALQQEEAVSTTGAVLIGDYSPEGLAGDAFDLKGARMDGAMLLLDVAYSGGCAEHEFSGFSPEVNITIFPPQITVFVVHDGNGDPCEAYPSETVSLDIGSLLDAHGNTFRLTVQPISSSSDPIVLDYGS